MTVEVAETIAQASEPDDSSRAGIYLAAMALGSSFQPNLLTRRTRDQAIISGLSAATGYGAATASHALMTSIADRLPGSRVAGEATLVVAGVVAAKVTPAREHESDRRAGIRLAGFGTAALGAASLASRLERRLTAHMSPRARFATSAALIGVGAAASYLALRNSDMRVGSELADGSFYEDSAPKEVAPGQAVAVSVGITAGLLGLARTESFASHQAARAAARIFGGSADDHVTLGRLTALGTSFVVGRALMNQVVTMLNKAGESVEVAHKDAPNVPEITGGPGSPVPWDAQSREGRRWLSMVMDPDGIERVMQQPAKQPIRVYASLKAAPDEESRAKLLLDELERTHAYDRSVIALFSPTGSGYVNYVANETLEYLTLGDCASAAIEYSVLPSSFSLLSVPAGTRQTRLVADGILRRLYGMHPEDRPKFVMFGESLGSQVSQGLFTDQGSAGPPSVGIEAAVWVGTPSASKWKKQLWGSRTIAEAPEVGPGPVYVPRNVDDWHNLPQDEREKVKYLLLQNGDDPIPKFGSQLTWRQPDWLGLDYQRPLGSPTGTRWIPFVTFVQTFVDMLNALTPTPGTFAEGGHDYRVEIPEAVRTVWKLPGSDEQMARVVDAMQKRELAWEAARSWESAEAKPDEKKRAKAEEKAEHQVAGWLGEDETVTPERIQEIISQGEEI